jgi:hypothetical protein
MSVMKQITLTYKFIEKVIQYKLFRIDDNGMHILLHSGDCRGRDRMVVGIATTYVISAYHH